MIRIFSDLLQIIFVIGVSVALVVHVHDVLNYEPHAVRAMKRARKDYLEQVDDACRTYLKDR